MDIFSGVLQTIWSQAWQEHIPQISSEDGSGQAAGKQVLGFKMKVKNHISITNTQITGLKNTDRQANSQAL